MASLKAAMAWDEQVFGLEYDLDLFNIVAVSDFNMGAMENKGLNIFNTKYVLAKPETATDADYQGIEAVIGHEYFHNWTGESGDLSGLVPAFAERGPDGLPRSGVFPPTAAAGRSSASPMSAPCGRGSSRKTTVPWPIRCVPTAISRSTISIPRPSMKKAPKWSA